MDKQSGKNKQQAKKIIKTLEKKFVKSNEINFTDHLFFYKCIFIYSILFLSKVLIFIENIFKKS